ncbi:MAG: serine/threonine protein kinase, partial [Chitinophagaceae bacterium]
MGKVFTITSGLENMGALKTGGQGSVYKGRRTGAIITAVKLLPTPIHSESTEDKHYMAFQNEVAKLRKVNEVPNPHVVRILSSGLTESGSFPFIEMEFVEGPDLEELLQPPHEPLFTIKEAVRVADQLSNALAHCHRVGVKHGDVKSNNVKYNVQTGNYVLLDFGMAIMSDEQRRTSLRHAGAIEFMAPEQNEGTILFQTDIYSFGVILFELLAGTVPFPLSERGETARSQVMLAHRETPPPDLMELRRKNLPAGWSEEKRARELQVPQWLIDTVYICLQKAPQSRFADGTMLHDHIILRSTQKSEAPPAFMPPPAPDPALEAEVTRLRQENEQLRKRLQVLQEREPAPLAAAAAPGIRYPARKRGPNIWAVLLVLAVLGVAAWIVIRKPGISKSAEQPVAESPSNLVAGQYMVKAARAYFYDAPDATKRRGAYMVPSSDVVNTTKEENDFVYTDFTNNRGQRSKGWLRKRDLMTLDEWNAQQQQQQAAEPQLTAAEIDRQLADARNKLDNGQLQEALFLYQFLAGKDV